MNQIPLEIAQKILNSLDSTIIILEGDKPVYANQTDIPDDILEKAHRAFKGDKQILNGTKQLMVDETIKIGKYNVIVGRITEDYSKILDDIKNATILAVKRLDALTA